MLKKLLLSCLVALTLGAKAQEISISESISMRTDMAFEIVGKLEGNTVVFVDKITTFELIAFNDRMYKKWQKELELEKKSPKVVGLSTSDNSGFYLFYTHRQKGHTYLKAHQYDHIANVLDTVTVADFGTGLNTPRLQMYLSEDKTKVLFYEVENAKIKQVVVFDTQAMELLWEDNFGDIELGTNQDLHQIVIDNTGNVYLILAKDNFVSKNKIHHFDIFERRVGVSQKDYYQIDLGGVLTYDNVFEFDNLNGNLVGGGLYSEKNRGYAQGYYFLKIPVDNHQNHDMYKEPFEVDFIEEFMDKDNPKQKGIADTEIKEILFRRDGGVLMIGERSKRSFRDGGTSAPYSPYMSRSRDFYYHNLFIYSIHPDGTKHWQEVLHKKQYSYDDDGIYSSYFLMKTPSSIRLIFNDAIKNENTVSEYVIKGNGDYQRNSILNTEDQDIRLQFKESRQTDAREFIVPSERRNRLRLVRMKF